MTQEAPQEVDWQVLEEAGPYPRQAFAFVQEGLSFTVRQVHRNYRELKLGERHVNGRQLCIGLRDYAIKKYGLMAHSVLETWNINKTDDFGRMVFAMIDAGIMSSTEQDSFEDFRSVYDFSEAFDQDRILPKVLPSN